LDVDSIYIVGILVLEKYAVITPKNLCCYL